MPRYRVYGLSAQIRSTAGLPFGALASRTYDGNDALRQGLRDWQEVLTVQLTQLIGKEQTT